MTSHWPAREAARAHLADDGHIRGWPRACRRIFNGHRAGSDDLGVHPPGYVPAGVGDFNHDGVADVIWHNPGANDIDEWLLANG